MSDLVQRGLFAGAENIDDFSGCADGAEAFFIAPPPEGEAPLRFDPGDWQTRLLGGCEAARGLSGWWAMTRRLLPHQARVCVPPAT